MPEIDQGSCIVVSIFSIVTSCHGRSNIGVGASSFCRHRGQQARRRPSNWRAFAVRPKMALCCRSRAQRQRQQTAGWHARQYSAVISALWPTDRHPPGPRPFGARSRRPFCRSDRAGRRPLRPPEAPNGLAMRRTTGTIHGRGHGIWRRSRSGREWRRRSPCPASERVPVARE